MRNMLLIASPVTDPKRFMAELGRHPDVAALPTVTLGNSLHAVARRTVRAACGAEECGDNLLSRARTEGAAALASYFAEIRSSTRTPVVVLHDPSGPMFPLLDPPGVDLLVLTRDADSSAVEIGAGGISRVVAAAREALAAFERRIAGFGLAPERIHAVDEARLRDEPAAVWPEVCRALGVDVGDQALGAILAASVSPWSLRGGPA